MKSQPYSSCQSLPASLTDLFNRAEELAGFVISGPGLFIPPFLIANSGGGVFTLNHRNLPSKNALQVFPIIAPVACMAHAASASVFAMHWWLHLLESNEPLKTATFPTALSGQREVLVLCGTTFSGHWHKVLSVVRASDGRFQKLCAAEDLSAEHTAAEISELFPVNPPTREEQMQAADFLDELNVRVSPWVPLPSLNN